MTSSASLDAPPPGALLTAAELGPYLRVSTKRVYELAAAGHLAGVRRLGQRGLRFNLAEALAGPPPSSPTAVNSSVPVSGSRRTHKGAK